MGLDPAVERHQRGAGGADLVGQCREAQRHALAGVALGLAVQRLMLAELLEQQHGKEARPRPAARYDMERRWWLGNRLTVPAGELLADGLDDLPLARDHLQRLGHILAQLRQPRAAARRAGAGCGDHDPLSRQVLGEGFAGRALALERGHARRLRRCGLGGKFILAGACLEFLELQLQLVEQPAAALGAGAVLLAPELGDEQLQVRDQGLVIGRLGGGDGKLRSTRSARAVAARSAALSASTSSGTGKTAASMSRSESARGPSRNRKMRLLPRKSRAYPALAGRQLYCGLRQSIPSSRHANCEAVRATTPSLAEGQMKRPFSSRLA